MCLLCKKFLIPFAVFLLTLMWTLIWPVHVTMLFVIVRKSWSLSENVHCIVNIILQIQLCWGILYNSSSSNPKAEELVTLYVYVSSHSCRISPEQSFRCHLNSVVEHYQPQIFVSSNTPLSFGLQELEPPLIIFLA